MRRSQRKTVTLREFHQHIISASSAYHHDKSIKQTHFYYEIYHSSDDEKKPKRNGHPEGVSSIAYRLNFEEASQTLVVTILQCRSWFLYQESILKKLIFLGSTFDILWSVDNLILIYQEPEECWFDGREGWFFGLTFFWYSYSWMMFFSFTRNLKNADLMGGKADAVIHVRLGDKEMKTKARLKKDKEMQHKYFTFCLLLKIPKLNMF